MFEAPTLEALNLGITLPVLSLSIGTCLLLVIDLFIPKERKHITVGLALGMLVFSFLANLLTFDSGTQTAVNAALIGLFPNGLFHGENALFGAFRADAFSGFINMTVLVTSFISVLLSIDYLRRLNIERGEYYTLLLFSASGAMLMGSANDLVGIFVALELLSIPLYILAAFRQPDLKSEESGIKYFILGAFASAFFVFGAALIYGASGTTFIPEIVQQIDAIVASTGAERFYLLLGAGLLLVGLGFKVAVVPFHMWTPDVYEGAPTPVTAFMSVAAKLGGFAALMRIFGGLSIFVLEGQSIAIWQTAIWVIAAATLIIGNLIAISQVNIKRMLAYSSIAHAGYILMAVAAAGNANFVDSAAQGALFYMLAYAFTNLGAFAVATALEKNDGTGTNLEDYVGLSKTQLPMAIIMAVFMLSLTGIPLTAGFMGKWLVFLPTIQANLIPLAIIGVLTSVISAFYYVRIIVNMFLRDRDDEVMVNSSPALNWAIYIAFAGTVLLGIVPFLATNLTNLVSLAVIGQ